MDWHEMVKSSPTFVDGKVSKEVTYSVQLFHENEGSDSIYTLGKKSDTDKKFVDIEVNEDLFDHRKFDPEKVQLRLCIEENVAWESINENGKNIWVEDKCEFYNKTKLDKKIDVCLPLNIVILKRESKREVPFTFEKDLTGEQKLHVLIEVIDPEEDLNGIKGLGPYIAPERESKTGKDFIKSLTHSVVGGDNCYGDFAPREFRRRTKSFLEEGPLALVKDEGRNRLKKYARSGVNPVAIIPVQEGKWWGYTKDGGEVELKFVGTVKVYFNPPPIAGDNYKIKISLVELDRGLYRRVQLKDGRTLEDVDCFETPTITVWKKIKVEAMWVQKGLIPDIIHWKEVKGAFKDAFIEFEEPNEIITLSEGEWIEYLVKAVYEPWGREKDWKRYEETGPWRDDLRKYSFPQGPRLVPPDIDKKNPNSNNTSWQFLGNICSNLVNDFLGNGKTEGKDNKKEKSKWKGKSKWKQKDLKDPHATKLGFFVLVCNDPFENSTVGGRYEFDRKFYCTFGGDVTGIFVHELGHALFLRHGLTDFFRHPFCNIAFSRRIEGGGQDGPFWDDHDSEDITSCVMSYNNGYWCSENSVEWHFCGMCLLTLRLYDVKSMLKSESGDGLRKMLYRGQPKVVWGKMVRKLRKEKGKKKSYFSLEVDDKNNAPILYPPLKDKKDEKKKKDKKKKKRNPYNYYPLNKSRLWVLALYPPDKNKDGSKVVNNTGYAYWKDVSGTGKGGFQRGRWRSTKPQVANVRVMKTKRKYNRKYWNAFINAKRPGKTKIYYEIRRGRTWEEKDVERSNELEITVKARRRR